MFFNFGNTYRAVSKSKQDRQADNTTTHPGLDLEFSMLLI